MMNKLCLAVLLICAFPAGAQKKIAVEDFTTKTTFRPRVVSGINWMKDGKYYSALEGNKIVRNNVATGKAESVIVDGAGLPQTITIEDYSFSADERKVLLSTGRQSIYRRSYTADYYVYDLATKSLRPLSAGGRQSYAEFSPDGTRVAFVRDRNLFFVDLGDMKETQVTSDGEENRIINGTTDWVYEEEFGFVTGFYWSPDSRAIAYYRFDESKVREYNMQVWRNDLYPSDHRFKYPKAGEENSTVEIWFYELDNGRKTRADLGNEKDVYIPRVMWTSDPALLSVRRLNRLQNRLELMHVDRTTGRATNVLNEESNTYVDLEYSDLLMYLRDGKHFLYATERSGFNHLYLYSMKGELIRAITQGGFEVSNIAGVDEKGRRIYYTSTEVSPLERHLYSISFDGKGKTRLTQAKGYHQINMSPDVQLYIDHYSTSSSPVKASLYATKGNRLVKELENNEALASQQKEYAFATKEFFTVRAADGSELNGYYLKPAGMVAGRKYPVLLYQYSGPGSQNVADSWGGGHYFFHQLMVQNEIIVAVVDTRGTGARGQAFKKVTYKQLGKYELEDLITTAKFLSEQPFIDGSRVGVWGWSYGGYMAALAMTKGAGTFKVGVAVAPVTNWRFYDTIYTERYLQTPQLNASGYDDNSPLNHAGALQGKFLLIHGTGDDNVHFQNSVRLQDALINAGRHFELMYYPDKHHGIQGAKTRHHLYSTITDFILANL